MAKDVITRFRLESSGFDSAIKKASKELSEYSKTATQAKEGFNQFSKSNVEAARALGTMATTSTNVKDKVKELVGAYNEAAKAYNNLSREHQQSDWAKALSGSLTQLQERIRETKAEMQGLASSTSSGGSIFSGMGDKMGGMLQVFGGNLMTKAFDFAVGSVVNLGSEISSCIKEGVELAKQGEGIRIAFERLGNGQILDGLREATHGTVTDIELMKAAVKFNDFKLPVEELGTMLAFAQQKAKDTGQSVDYMVDSIVTGLGRKSLMILDNLGLSAAEIKEKMAETGDMTKAVGAIIREQMAKAGDYVETAADRAAQAHVSLQNKMEELGRLYQPLQEASNTFWTSMKVGILDVVAGPLAKLLNGLTEAGSQMKMLQNANGGQNGERTRVNSQLDTLKNVRRSGSDFMVNRIYSKQVEDYNRQIVDIDTMLKQSKGVDKGSILKKASEQFGQDFFSTHELKRYQEALRTMRDQYISGARDIMKPVKVDIKTDSAVRDVDSLRVKLSELEAQRKKAIKAGDQDLAKNLTKQITQIKSDIKALDPNALKTTTSHTLTKPEQADAKYVQAQKDYEQSLQQAALEVKAGTINSAEAKKKELQAAETLWKSIGDAREVYDSPKLKEAQAKVEAKIVALGPEVDKAIEAQKAVEKASRELEMANKKAADARAKLADAEATGELKKILPAQKAVTEADREVTRKETVLHELQEKTVKVNVEEGNVNLPKVPTDDETIKVNIEQGDVNLPEIPDEKAIKVDAVPGDVKVPEVKEEVQVPAIIKPTQDNIDAAISFLKDKIAESEIGTDVFNKLTEQLSDATALGGIISEMVKQGVNTADFSEVINSMWAQLKEGDIDDSAIQSFLEKVNEKIKEQGGIQLDMNANTGEVSRKKGENEELKETQKLVSGLSQVASGLQAMGIMLPSEVTKVLSALQGAMTVVQGVSSMVSVFGSTSMASNTAAMGANTGALVANTSAMLSLQAALAANTAVSLIPFAEGGVIPKFANSGLIGKAADGMLIPGNSYSGDRLRMPVDGGRGVIGVNSGELILNMSSQDNLAAMIKSAESLVGTIRDESMALSFSQVSNFADAFDNEGGGAISSTPYVTGETIFLGLNNYTKANGYGEVVTSRR